MYLVGILEKLAPLKEGWRNAVERTAQPRANISKQSKSKADRVRKETQQIHHGRGMTVLYF